MTPSPTEDLTNRREPIPKTAEPLDQDAEVHRLQRQNESILRSAGDGIYGFDFEGRTTFVNPAAAEMLGSESRSHVDFVRGSTLQLTGTPMIRWELDREDNRTGGTRHYWAFTVEKWVERAVPRQISWGLVDYSRFNPVIPAGVTT